MTIAMQTQATHCAGPIKAAPHTVERLRDGSLIRRQQIGRNEIVGQQVIARLFAESDDVERRTLREWLLQADCMNVAKEAPSAFQRISPTKIGRTATMAFNPGETKALVLLQA